MFTPRDAKRMREEEEGAVSNLISPESKYLDGGKRRSTMVDIFPTFFSPDRGGSSCAIFSDGRRNQPCLSRDSPDDNQQLWTTTSQTIEESKRCCKDIQIFHWVSNFYTTFAFGKYCPVYTYCLPILCFICISAICLARRKNTLTKNT